MQRPESHAALNHPLGPFPRLRESDDVTPVKAELVVGDLAVTAPEVRVVRWIDSSLQNGQVDRHDFPKPEVITSVGYVVDETDEHVTLARDDMNNGDFRGLCCIPKIAVLA